MAHVVSVSEAAILCRCGPRVIRKALDDGVLAFTEGARNGGKAGQPGRVRWIDIEELQAWAEATKRGAAFRGDWRPPDEVARLAVELEALRARVISLERQLLARPASVVPLADSLEGIPSYLPERRRSPATLPLYRRQQLPTASTRTLEVAGTMPAGYVSVNSYSMAHGARERQQTTFKASRFLPIIRPPDGEHWTDNSPRHISVRNALDASGQRIFHEIWGGWGVQPRAEWWKDPAPGVCALCDERRSEALQGASQAGDEWPEGV
jgi:hypothetical protein